MDVKKSYWFGGSVRERTPTIRLGRSYTKPGGHHRSSYWLSSYGNTKPTVWEVLWRKMRLGRGNNNKKKVLSNGGDQAIYDTETYSKNFDHGMGWMEPDNLCRSFSARFANPASRIFPPTHFLD